MLILSLQTNGYFRHCRGADDRKLNYDYRPKSVSAEVNYGIRFQNKEETESFIKQLCNEVEKRLNDAEMLGKGVTLKLMVFIMHFYFYKCLLI